STRGRDSDATVRGRNVRFGERAPEVTPKVAHHSKLELPFPLRELRKYQRLEGIPDGANSAALRGPQHSSEHSGEHMRVLVRVQVGDGNSSRLKLRDLRRDLCFDLVFVQSSSCSRCCKAHKTIAELRRRIGQQKTGNARRCR